MNDRSQPVRVSPQQCYNMHMHTPYEFVGAFDNYEVFFVPERNCTLVKRSPRVGDSVFYNWAAREWAAGHSASGYLTPDEKNHALLLTRLFALSLSDEYREGG